MTDTDQLRAELAVAELQEEFIAAKERYARGEIDFDEFRAIKQKHHDARVAFREGREARAAEVAGGDAAVSPGTVHATATSDGGVA